MKIIGVTGGVGSGKTTLLNEIEHKYNARVIYADVVAKKLEEPGEICYVKLVELLGEDILSSDRKIDPKAMSSKIFADQSLLTLVNNIIHPSVDEYIIDEIDNELAKDRLDFLFIEAAILTEANYLKRLDEMWYVYADMDVRIDRLSKGRGYSIDKSKSIISAQSSDAEYRNVSQVTIDNSGDITNSLKQVAERLL